MAVVNTVWFVAGSSGVADFSDGAALTGARNIAGGGLVNGREYSYRAEHPTDKSIWENGYGAVNTGTGVLVRNVAESSTGAKINFAVAPVVLLTTMKRDFELLAPFDAMAERSIIFNSCGDAHQDTAAGLNLLTSGTEKYIADGIVAKYSGAGLVVNAGFGDASIWGSLPAGISNAVGIQAATGKAAPAAADYAWLEWRIEGYDVFTLNLGKATATFVTFDFWFFSSAVTGTAILAVMNAAENRSYPASFTINAAGTWEYKQVTFQVDTTAGAWLYTNGLGLRARFVALAGSNNQVTANQWNGGGQMSSAAAANLFAANGNFFAVTGMLGFPGRDGPRDTESSRCILTPTKAIERSKRYFQKLGGVTIADILLRGYASTADSVAYNFLFPVEMRAAPTMTEVGAWNKNNVTGSLSMFSSSKGFGVQYQVAATGGSSYYTQDASTYITANARL